MHTWMSSVIDPCNLKTAKIRMRQKHNRHRYCGHPALPIRTVSSIHHSLGDPVGTPSKAWPLTCAQYRVPPAHLLWLEVQQLCEACRGDACVVLADHQHIVLNHAQLQVCHALGAILTSKHIGLQVQHSSCGMCAWME